MIESNPCQLHALCLGLFLVALPVWAEPCPEDDERVARVAVTIDLEASAITVDPFSVEIAIDPGPGRPNRVCWTITGLGEGQSVDFETKEGSDDYFPSLERTVQYPRDYANSGKPSHAGTWLYDVVLKAEDGEELIRLDPEVDIVDGPP